MGSYNQVVIPGFVCRLCSESKSNAIHIYSKKGAEQNLLKKLEFIIPVKVKKSGRLSKLICHDCIGELTEHCNFIMELRRNFDIRIRHEKYHKNGCPPQCPLDYSHAREARPDRQPTDETSCEEQSIDEERHERQPTDEIGLERPPIDETILGTQPIDEAGDIH